MMQHLASENEHHVILDCGKGKKYHHTSELPHFGTHSSGVKSITNNANFIEYYLKEPCMHTIHCMYVLRSVLYKSTLHTITNRKAKTECLVVTQLCLVKPVCKQGSGLDCYMGLGVLQTRRNGINHFAHWIQSERYNRGIIVSPTQPLKQTVQSQTSALLPSLWDELWNKMPLMRTALVQ